MNSKNYMKTQQCTCANCTCNVSKKITKEYEEEKIYRFLMELDAFSFGTIRSQILGLDSLPSINKVYSIIIQEERH